MATCGRTTFTASTMTYPLMIVHCDVDRRIEYQAFVSGRLREREGMVSFRGPCTATNYEGAPNERWPSRIERDQTRLSPRGRAECTRASRLDVNSHKPNNLPQHSGNDSGVASVKNVLIRKVENNGCYRCCAESLHCIPPLFQSVDPLPCMKPLNHRQK